MFGLARREIGGDHHARSPEQRFPAAGKDSGQAGAEGKHAGSLAHQPLNLPPQNCLTRRERIDIERPQLFAQGITLGRLLHHIGEQGQIAEPGGNAPGFGPPLFQLGQHRFRAADHRPRHARQSRHGQTERAFRRTRGDFVQQHQIALPFTRADMVERQRLTRISQPRQFMIMGGKQAAAPVDPMHRLGHRPCQREAVIGAGAAPDLVEDDEAAR
ncbi:hypothetical protein E4T56_gene20429, partial [Termitomyces sp. T112]